MPHNRYFDENTPVLIATGVRVCIEPGWFLACLPRSGLGFKYGMTLRNTMGVIDSDYYHADNEGHIMASIKVDVPVTLQAGDRFMQGIFMPYGISENGNSSMEKRTGGMGSTGVQG